MNKVDLQEGIVSVSTNKENIDFGTALQTTLVADGIRIARTGWNGAGLAVYRVSPEGIEPHLVIRNPKTGKINTWVPSSADLIANDWVIV